MPARTETRFVIIGAGAGGICAGIRLLESGRDDFVILEKDELRVQELDLGQFQTDVPALAADAAVPDNLLIAGLRHTKCRGVLALTDDERANLGIAIAARLMNPKLPVLACAQTPLFAANMASFGTDHIINPFERFAEYLALAVAAPQRYRLIEILTGLPGSAMPWRPPRVTTCTPFLPTRFSHRGFPYSWYRTCPPSRAGPNGALICR